MNYSIALDKINIQQNELNEFWENLFPENHFDDELEKLEKENLNLYLENLSLKNQIEKLQTDLNNKG